MSQTNNTRPNAEDTLAFWKELYDQTSTIDNEKEFIKEYVESRSFNNDIHTITIFEVEKPVKCAANSKAQGPDGINGYYWKYLPQLWITMMKVFNTWYIRDGVPHDETTG